MDDFGALVAGLLEAYLSGKLSREGFLARLGLGEESAVTPVGRPADSDMAPVVRRTPSGQTMTGLTIAARKLFNEWVEATGRKQSRPTADRITRVIARLREGYTEDEIRRAIRNVAASEWHRGQNDRGKEYVDLSMICGSGERLERYRDMDQVPDAPTTWEQEAEAALTAGRFDDYERINANRHGSSVGQHVKAGPGRPAEQASVPAGGGGVPAKLRLAGLPKPAANGSG